MVISVMLLVFINFPWSSREIGALGFLPCEAYRLRSHRADGAAHSPRAAPQFPIASFQLRGPVHAVVVGRRAAAFPHFAVAAGKFRVAEEARHDARDASKNSSVTLGGLHGCPPRLQG